jgi:hypothetical protein
MKEFKGTRGEVYHDKEESGINEYGVHFASISTDGIKSFIDVYGKDKEAIENRKLIIDAFKVRQSINCELSELLEQRNEMLAMLEKVLEKDFDYDYYKEVQQLIKKVKDNG